MNMNKKIATAALAVLLVLGGAAAGHQGSILESAVSKALWTLPRYGVFDNLAFSVNGRDVVLSGQVLEPSTRQEAVRRVRRIRGVGRVVDSIEVLPVSPGDDAIRKAAYRALFATSALQRYAMGANPSIHIVVKDGHITLVGIVSSKEDAARALLAIRGVPGSMSQKSLLKVAEAARKPSPLPDPKPQESSLEAESYLA